MAKARLIGAIATGAAILLLAGLRAAQVPEFHLDAQYYVQSALLWPRGEVTFAASLIGGRDLVVLIWHVAFGAWGNHLEALSAALACVYGLTCLALALGIFRLEPRAAPAAVASIAVAIAAWPLSIWSTPASDAPGAMAMAMLWSLSTVIGASRIGMVALAALGFVAALSLRLRSELVVLAVVAVAAGFSEPGLRRRAAAALSVAVAAIATGAIASAQLWSLWVPVARPDMYAAIFPVYRAFDDFAIGANGPASRRLADELGLGPQDDLPFWDSIARTYVSHGVRASDRLVGRAGLEAMARDPATFVRNALHDACAEPCGGGSLLPGLAVARIEPGAAFASARASLERLDELRRTASPRFAGDATWPTASLADARHGTLARWQSAWPWHARWTLPRAAPWIGGIVLLAAAWLLRGRLARALAAPAIYGVIVAGLAAATQGPIARYVEAAVLLQFAALAAALPALMRRPRRAAPSSRYARDGAEANRATRAG